MTRSYQTRRSAFPNGPSDCKLTHYPYVLRLVRKAATLEGVAGVGGTILVILYGIASWKGFFDLYWPIIQVTGGVAETIFQFLAFPAVPIVLIYLFILYLVFLTDTEEGTARATWLPIVGWFSFIATFCTLLSVLMFVCFIDTSGIPDAVAYYKLQAYERNVKESEYQVLYPELRKIASSLLVFRVSAVRDPEAMQYGMSILRVFRDAGIKTANDADAAQLPSEIDVYATSVHGLFLYAKQNPAAQSAAAALRDAFRAAKIDVTAGLLRESDADSIDFMVGYR